MQQFRNNIDVPGNAFFSEVILGGKHTAIFTNVQKNDETNLDNPFIYYVQETDYFLNVTQNNDTASGTPVDIILPIAKDNKGRLLWVWDGATENASSKNIVIYTADNQVLTTLYADRHIVLLICNGTKWFVVIKDIMDFNL